ncbi:MAG: retropepsin-like domain-containing protein [Gemmataceae bacterium]|nr:retropepsin-like domain-containing protein [Gemmataceae bacterium]
MWFRLPIVRHRLHQAGLDFVRVEGPLTVIGGRHGDKERMFRFDTGCEITTVSEDVAAALGLPAGGRPVGMRGSTGSGSARFVPVRLRFPPDPYGGPGVEVDSTWAVVRGPTNLALLGFQEVHRHFTIMTHRDVIDFLPWPATKPWGQTADADDPDGPTDS